MYDIELVREILRQILGAAQTITKRFAPITSYEDQEFSIYITQAQKAAFRHLDQRFRSVLGLLSIKTANCGTRNGESLPLQTRT